MAANGSPDPVFDTDSDSTHVLVTLGAHSKVGIQAGNLVSALVFNSLDEVIAFSNGASNGAGNGAGRPAIAIIRESFHDRVAEMLTILLERMKRVDLFEKMDLSNQSRNRAKYLDPLIELQWVAMEFPEERTHPNQTYQTTDVGRSILNLISIE
jgi:ATP-dependent DNA helicase RecG